jgi:predicted membrane channel-forming protein YqfA (hemolysin III family)
MTDVESDGAGRDRPSRDELNRELIELLNEVRNGLPGLTVLFAFLLTLPFTSRFDDLTWLQETAYLIAFFATTAAIVLLVTPSIYHRVRWRQRDKDALLRRSNVLAVVGFAFLGVAIVSCVLLVAELVLPTWLGLILTATVALLVLVLWFGMPVSRRVRGRSSDLPRP